MTDKKNAPVDVAASAGARGTKSTSPKSTTAKAQRTRILEALRSGPKNSYELRRIGCYQCPARILELRRLGHKIKTTRITLWDRDGFPHKGAALYILEDDARSSEEGKSPQEAIHGQRS